MELTEKAVKQLIDATFDFFRYLLSLLLKYLEMFFFCFCFLLIRVKLEQMVHSFGGRNILYKKPTTHKTAYNILTSY